MVKKIKNEREDTKHIEELNDLKVKLARALADYDNLQKRVARDREELYNIVKMQLIVRLLPAFDMLMDAQKHLADAGLAIAIKGLTDTLSQEEIVIIEPKVGEPFNHDLHEAIESIEGSKDQNNSIAECLAVGYRLEDGGVIRHAKVKVYKN